MILMIIPKRTAGKSELYFLDKSDIDHYASRVPRAVLGFCRSDVPESSPSQVLVLRHLWLVRRSDGILACDVLVVIGVLLVAEVVIGLEAAGNE